MDLFELSDFELMKRIREGEKSAFLALVERYQQTLFQFFCRMGVCRAESEDLVQEVFLRIFSCRFRYRPTAKFLTFLYTVARHVWVDFLRKTKNLKSIDWTEDQEERISAEDCPNFVSQVEASLDIQYALSGLSEKLRIVVVMALYQNLRYQEIAEILDIPVGTVKSRINLAFQQLREIFSESQKNLR